MSFIFLQTDHPSITIYFKRALKWMGYASLCLAFCFVASCSTDQDPDPADTGPDRDLTPSDLLSSKTIDSDGGVIETEGFSLTVPAGAFNTETELKIYAEEENHFESPNISPVFRIEGLPGEVNDPVQFKITPSEDPDSTTFMALGTAMDFTTKADPQFVFLLYPANDSGGDLITDFQPDEDWKDVFNSGRKSATSIFEINAYLWVAMKKEYKGLKVKRVATTGEIKLNFPVGFNGVWAQNMLMYLDIQDRALKIILENTDIYKKTNENLNIQINPFGSDQISDGEYIYAAARTKWLPQPIILINSNYVKDQDAFRLVYARLYHQYMLAKFDKDVLQPNRYWFHIAAASYFSDKSVNYSNEHVYSPLNWRGNELTVLRGLIAGSGGNLTDANKHGFGMMSLLRYIDKIHAVDYSAIDIFDSSIKLFSDFLPEKLYKEKDIVKTIISLSAGNIEEWWTEYIQYLIDGDLYEVSPQTVLDAVVENYTLNTDADTSYTFTNEFPDLSAKLYRVDLNKNFEDQDYLSVSVTGEKSFVSVYKISDNNSFDFIDSGTDIYIKGLQDLVASGNDLLLLITNSKNVAPYTGTTSIDCTVEHKKSDFPFNYCEIVVRAKARYDDDLQGVYDGNLFIKWKAYGTYEDGLFKADYRPDDNHVITMEIEIDPVKMNILDFHASETEKNQQTDYTDYDAIEGSGKELGGYKVYASRQYHVQGEETGSYIDLITSYNGTPGFMTDLLSVSYDSDSELKITFEFKQP